MSQTTRCPSCGTKFKVVADQLRISEGWVRCGQCEQVFDATLTLESPGMAAAAPVAAAPVAPSDAAAGYALPTAVDDDDDLPLDAAPMRSVSLPQSWPELTAEPEPEPEPAIPPVRESAPDKRFDPEFDSAAQDFAALEPGAQPESEQELPPDSELEPEPEPEPVPQSEREPDATETAAADPFALPQLPEAEPGFVRAARRKAFWHAPGVRLALVLGSTVLLFGLALQIAQQERNALAAWQPSLRPALQGLCTLTGCTLSARQDISQVVIASSAFTRSAQADNYLLSLTIENQAGTELAMPAVELTLTDLQDQPVLRRVLLPADLQAPATLGAQSEWSVRIPLAVAATPTRIAGYRALVFYP